MMKFESIQKANVLASKLAAQRAAIDSLVEGADVCITIGKTAKGPGAQVHLKIGHYDTDLRNILTGEFDITCKGLIELGVEL